MPLDQNVLNFISTIPRDEEEGEKKSRFNEKLASFEKEAVKYKPSEEEKEAQRKLQFARKRLGKSWFPGTKAGLVGLGASLVAPVARVTGQGELADEIQRMSAAYQRAAGERDVGGIVPPIIKRGARGILQTAPTMVVTGGALGPYGAILTAAGQEADRAVTEGKDRGLKGRELTTYITAKGVIEGGVASVFQKIGLGGAEKLAGGRQAVTIGTSSALKKLGIMAIKEELPEELITELGHNVADAVAKVDPEALSAESLAQTAADTTVQTLMTMGVLGAPGVMRAKREASIRAEITKYAKEGKVPTRRKWTKDWDLPADEGAGRRDRKAGVIKLAASFQTEGTRAIEAAQAAPTPAPGVQVDQAGIIAPTPTGQQAVAGGALAAGAEPIPEGVPPWLKEEEAETMRASAPDVKVEQPKKGSEIGDFIKDSAGRVGISTEAFSRGIGFTKHALQRFLTSRGEFPQEIYRADIRRRGKISRVQKEIAFVQKDYDKAIKGVFGKREISEQEAMPIEAVLRGEAPLESLPESLREPVYKFRKGIDAGSQLLIDIGAVQGRLAATVGMNRGVYITRTYRAHTEPGWAKSVPVEIRNKAIALYRQEYPRATEDEIHGLVDAQLYKSGLAATPIALVKEDHLGAKDLSILKRRKDIPPEIRALLGEYADPRLNYARSMTVIGNLAANHQFQQEIREAGLGTFFSMEPSSGTPNGDLITQIEAGEDSPIHALHGLWTTPEIAAAFKRATTTQQMPSWLRVVLALNGAVKVAKTVFSLMTGVRNFTANTGFAVMNGHWRIGNAKTAFKGTMTGLLNLNDEEYRAYYLDAVEHGIVKQSVHAEELRANIRDAAGMGLEEFAIAAETRRAKGVKRVIRDSGEMLGSIYQAEDDVWKLYAWENEKTRYKEAYPEISQHELKSLTAEIVSNTYPTYSRVPEAIKNLRRFPLTGAFVSFPAEVIRTIYHTLSLARSELADPRTRRIGAERAVGSILALSGGAAIAAAMRMLVGVSLDDDDDMRYFVPPWQENSLFAHIGRKLNGDFRYIDLAYSDPHNTLITPLKAFMRGDDIIDGIWNGMKDVAVPFAGEEILFKAFTEVWRNDADGRPIYNPQDSMDQQAADVTAHLWKPFEPGTITSLRRIGRGITGEVSPTGRAYDPTIETIAMIAGMRIQDLDIRQSLSWRAKGFMKDIRNADKILLEVIGSRGNVSSAKIMDAYSRADESRREIWGRLMKTEQAAARLGIAPSEVYEILKSSGVPQIDLEFLLRGQAPPIRITKSRLKTMGLANPDKYLQRYEILMRAEAETTATP